MDPRDDRAVDVGIQVMKLVDLFKKDYKLLGQALWRLSDTKNQDERR